MKVYVVFNSNYSSSEIGLVGVAASEEAIKKVVEDYLFEWYGDLQLTFDSWIEAEKAASNNPDKYDCCYLYVWLGSKEKSYLGYYYDNGKLDKYHESDFHCKERELVK